MARRLILEDPRVVNKYNADLTSRLKEANVYNRLFEIYKKATFPLHPNMIKEYEKIDKEIVDHQMEAEKKCRKLRVGHYQSSPTLRKGYQIVDYWKKRINYIQGDRRCISARQLINIQKRLGITFRTMTLSEAYKQLEISKKHLKSIKINARALHIEHRQQLAEALAAQGNIPASTHIKMRLFREKQRDEARSMRYMLKRTSTGTTTKVQVTDERGTVREVTDKDEMEKLILCENEKKYHQTERGTQLHHPEFVKKLGRYANGPEVDRVLLGNFDYPTITKEATKDFLDACSRVNNLPEADTNNVRKSFYDYMKAWNIRKEKTCSAHQHMGHYKAGIKNQFISTILYMRSEIPVVSGYSPSRWRDCIDLMILKKAMNFNLDKQRTLGILDTEYNQCNKILQKQAMSLALRTNQLAPEQYSRPGRDCRDHALNRKLTADCRQYERKCWSISMSDLTGCYDRIVHTAAALALIRLGIKKEKIHVMFDTIQRMSHRVRTAFGDSTTTYGGDSFKNWDNAPQGILQGNAAGPVVWTR